MGEGNRARRRMRTAESRGGGTFAPASDPPASDPPGSDHGGGPAAGPLIHQALQALDHRLGDRLDDAAAALASRCAAAATRRAVVVALLDALTAATAVAWQRGWQPADVQRVAGTTSGRGGAAARRRRHGPRAQPIRADERRPPLVGAAARAGWPRVVAGIRHAARRAPRARHRLVHPRVASPDGAPPHRPAARARAAHAPARHGRVAGVARVGDQRPAGGRRAHPQQGAHAPRQGRVDDLRGRGRDVHRRRAVTHGTPQHRRRRARRGRGGAAPRPQRRRRGGESGSTTPTTRPRRCCSTPWRRPTGAGWCGAASSASAPSSVSSPTSRVSRCSSPRCSSRRPAPSPRPGRAPTVMAAAAPAPSGSRS